MTGGDSSAIGSFWPEIEQRLTSDGAEVVAGTSEAFEKTLRAELERLEKMVKASGARLD